MSQTRQPVTDDIFVRIPREQFDEMKRFFDKVEANAANKDEVTTTATYTPIPYWEAVLLLDVAAQNQGQALPENLMSHILYQLRKTGYEMCRRDPK